MVPNYSTLRYTWGPDYSPLDRYHYNVRVQSIFVFIADIIGRRANKITVITCNSI